MNQNKIDTLLHIMALIKKSKTKITYDFVDYGNCGIYIKYARKSQLTNIIQSKLDDANLYYDFYGDCGLEGKKEFTSIFIPIGKLEDYNKDEELINWYDNLNL